MTASADSPLSGWMLEPTPGKPVRRTDDGRMALPLRLSRHGHTTDAELILTTAEAKLLHDVLSDLLEERGTR